MKVLVIIGMVCISIGFFINNISGGFIATGFMILLIAGKILLDREEKANLEKHKKINEQIEIYNSPIHEYRHFSAPSKPTKK